MSLTPRQRRYLRGLGHDLKPVVQVGREGVTDAVAGAVAAALETHELVKIRVGDGAPADRHEVADDLAARTTSDLVQVLGRTILLYRRRAGEPIIELPGP